MTDPVPPLRIPESSTSPHETRRARLRMTVLRSCVVSRQIAATDGHAVKSSPAKFASAINTSFAED